MFCNLHGEGLHTIIAVQFITDIPQLEEHLLNDIFHIFGIIQQAPGTSRQLSPQGYDFYFKLFLFHSIKKTRHSDKRNMMDEKKVFFYNI